MHGLKSDGDEAVREEDKETQRLTRPEEGDVIGGESRINELYNILFKRWTFCFSRYLGKVNKKGRTALQTESGSVCWVIFFQGPTRTLELGPAKFRFIGHRLLEKLKVWSQIRQADQITKTWGTRTECTTSREGYQGIKRKFKNRQLAKLDCIMKRGNKLAEGCDVL